MGSRDKLPTKEEVEQLVAGGLKQREIGKLYGVSQQAVYDRLHERRCIDCGATVTRSAVRCRACHLHMAREGDVGNRHRGVETRFICEACGNEFEIPSHRAKRHKPRFCSLECRKGQPLNGAFHKIAYKRCPCCGKLRCGPFHSIANQYGFCSSACVGLYAKRERWEGVANGYHCECCGKNFAVDWGLMASQGHYLEKYGWRVGRFCSLDCFREWNRAGNHENWQGGDCGIYPDEFYIVRETVLARDCETCAICKMYGNNVHHIDYDKENSDPSNLITLCIYCHGKTNFNREYWQPALSALLANRHQCIDN